LARFTCFQSDNEAAIDYNNVNIKQKKDLLDSPKHDLANDTNINLPIVSNISNLTPSTVRQHMFIVINLTLGQ